MLELYGKYNTAKVFASHVDNETMSQIITLLNQPFVADSQIRIMADTHAGAGCVIGTTMTITDKIVPNLVGVDIGCGMRAVKLKQRDIDLPKLDETINTFVPAGFCVHDEPILAKTHTDYLRELACYQHINADLAYKSIGTLGGGNHFIEVDRGQDGALWLVIHTGSRHLGLEVCKYYQDQGYLQMHQYDAEYLQKKESLISALKANGQQRAIPDALKELDTQWRRRQGNVPKELAYVEGQLFDDYIHDVKIVQKHAANNRTAIADIICDRMGFEVEDHFDTIHNYVDTENMILRKGSISAQKGERVLIPMNMRDGSLICIGKGNPDYNYSAPHGAGRLMSRAQAKDQIDMDDFRNVMADIYSTSVCSSTLDEAPMAYKPMEEIKANIQDTVDIIDNIKPIYNFKAH